MEAQNRKNYAGEIISDYSALISDAENLINNITQHPKYSFGQLFNEVERNGNKEYHRNDIIWQDIYNTWDKNAYEELVKPESEQRKKNEVKGLYIFYEDNKPAYVGISRTILKRMKNHFRGTTHFEATLVYLMLRYEHDEKHGLYTGERKDFPRFETHRVSKQQEMIDTWKISIIPELDNYKMYFFEIYLACHLGTYWNSFETH